ncbi:MULTISPECIES: hypothetical protein [unclassified Sulfitobacter]|uniref:hypothetical protein n=1 Tax=unclassified Sulfitobacter TaxID=196795 RepID=UPI0037467ED8
MNWLSLFGPARRERFDDPRKRHVRLVSLVKDRLNNMWRGKRQPQNAGHVGSDGPFALAQRADGIESLRFQQNARAYDLINVLSVEIKV